MVLSQAQANGPSLVLIEGGLTVVALAVSFGLPGFGSLWFSRIERVFNQLARRKSLSVALVGVAAFVLRLAVLPFCPIPLPFLTDDFSFLLAADTFASGRLTNPTPAMWVNLESIHVTMKPTYMSMYFPGQGLVLAAGKVLTGHPWYGILVVTALMCAAICWMLQAWLPPSWALLGGLLAVLRLGLFSYWINSYSGAGSIVALGGALVLGALPRFIKHARFRDALLMAIGIVLLGICRPYDGLLLCLPVAVYLGRWIFRGKNRLSPALLLRRTALPLALIIAAGAWMAYYDYRVFGDPLTLPYSVNRAQYALAPYFIWQSKRPEPNYRHKVIREFYYQDELNNFNAIHSLSGFIPETLLKVARAFLFYAGISLLIPLIMVRRVFLDRRLRFLILCLPVLIAGQLIEVFLLPHYLAAYTAVFYAIGLQAMRHLRLWKPGGHAVGFTLQRSVVTICVLMAALRVVAEPLHFALPRWPTTEAAEWVGFSSSSGTERAKTEAALKQMPGKQLAIVRYAPGHNPQVEWVYNTADLDNAKIVWAWDMDNAANQNLIGYYKDRTVWLVEPDATPAKVTPYASPAR
jgi:hypothetical protein